MPTEDESHHIKNVLNLAHQAKAKGDWKGVREAAGLVLLRDPRNIEAKVLCQYAIHHPDPSCRPTLAELKEAGIPEEYDPEPLDPGSPTSQSRNDGYLPGFGPWDDRVNSWIKGIYQWDVFITYRNVEPDASMARSAAQFLADTEFYRDMGFKRCRVFFAPFSLGPEMLRYETAWTFEIESAIMSSYHFIGYISKDYIDSPYCELEFQVIKKIVENAPLRRLSYLVAEEDQVKAKRSFGVEKGKYFRTSKDVIGTISESFGNSLGKPYFPKRVLKELPLRKLDMELHVWSEKKIDFINPPYEPYECIVRDKMVRILKGLDPSYLPISYSKNPLWKEHHNNAAYRSAKILIESGITPYQVEDQHKIKEKTKGQSTKNIRSEKENRKVTRKCTHKSADISRTYRPSGKWYELIDYGGKGYPQDMDFVCYKCNHHEGVGNPNNAPDSCSKCGYQGEYLHISDNKP